MCSLYHVCCQALCRLIMRAPSSKTMPLRSSLGSCRRALGAAGAASTILMLLPQAAQALIKGYEPMTALKGKDYGKERQRLRSCALACYSHRCSLHSCACTALSLSDASAVSQMFKIQCSLL